MRLGPLITVLAILAPFSAAEQQDTSCGTVPGQEAVPHAVGNFTIPNGSTPSFSAGTSMNISWDTTFQLSTLWLITGCDFADPTKSLVVGTSLTYFIWDVETTSTNTSELYSFRVVDSDGSTSDQESGGFWSAVFYIDQTTTTTSSSISSTSTSTSSISSATSAAATTTGGSSATTASPAATSTTAAAASSGLSTGAKAGVGVGVALGALGLVGLGFGFFFWNKNKNLAATQAQQPMLPPNQPVQEYYKPPEGYPPHSQYSSGYQTEYQGSIQSGYPPEYPAQAPSPAMELDSRGHNPPTGPVYEMH